HERWDGAGYPDGLSGDAIPLLGRIIHIGDAFDAITTDRVYRGSQPVSAAMDEIRAYAGSQFDPQCVRAVSEARRQGLLEDSSPEHTPTVFELIDQISH
ncbi:MAG: phosphohydrolase, partial [Planctomycetota bacterium]|nr:phosphohydrolase [Planctomycetota bacterium]